VRGALAFSVISHPNKVQSSHAIRVL
jgi:hypothetical protein